MSFGKDNRGPSIAELQRYIREKVTLAFILQNGEQLVGRLRWFDDQAYSVMSDGEQPFTILRSAVVGYRPHNQNASSGSPAASGAQKDGSKQKAEPQAVMATVTADVTESAAQANSRADNAETTSSTADSASTQQQE